MRCPRCGGKMVFIKEIKAERWRAPPWPAPWHYQVISMCENALLFARQLYVQNELLAVILVIFSRWNRLMMSNTFPVHIRLRKKPLDWTVTPSRIPFLKPLKLRLKLQYSAAAELSSTHRCRRTQTTRPLQTLKSLGVLNYVIECIIFIIKTCQSTIA
jgi:hypothetical protein